MDERYKRYVVWFAAAIAICWSAYHVFGRPMGYELPEGFKGWLTIRFADPTCPPLRSQGIFLMVSVPTSGRVCTSTSHPDGWIYYRFVYLHSDGSKTSVPLRSGSTLPQKVYVWLVAYLRDCNWEEDWVGTNEEADHWGSPPDPWRQSSVPNSSTHR
jgi:uncharacterized protein DUF6843